MIGSGCSLPTACWGVCRVLPVSYFTWHHSVGWMISVGLLFWFIWWFWEILESRVVKTAHFLKPVNRAKKTGQLVNRYLLLVTCRDMKIFEDMPHMPAYRDGQVGFQLPSIFSHRRSTHCVRCVCLMAYFHYGGCLVRERETLSAIVSIANRNRPIVLIANCWLVA